MKDILGYEEYYSIEKNGTIYRKDRRSTFLTSGHSSSKEKYLKTNLIKGGLQKTWKNKFGYILVSLSDRNGRKNNLYLHRLLMTAYVPNPENKGDVNHKNGIKHDNRLENLEWCTRRDNLVHALRTGLRKPNKGLSGESNPSAVLKKEDIPVIRQLRKQGVPLKEIAKQFGVTKSPIYAITSGKSWKTY